MIEVSLDDYAAEADYALSEAEDQGEPSLYPRMAGRRVTVLSLWEQHLNFLSEGAYESALRDVDAGDEFIQAQVRGWLRDREIALHIYCNNPTCSEWLRDNGPRRLLQEKTGRRKRFCNDKCRDSAKKRAKRNAAAPNRDERGITAMRNALQKPRYIIAGSGRRGRAQRQKAIEGYRSVLSLEAIAQEKLTLRAIGEHLDRQNGWMPEDQERVEQSVEVHNGRDETHRVLQMEQYHRYLRSTYKAELFRRLSGTRSLRAEGEATG